jgi:hypothetical protein
MAGFKIKVNIDSASLKQIIQKKQELIQANIVAILKREAVPHLIDLIMIGYDSLSDVANQGPDDPTNPAHWRDEFRTNLEEDLAQTFTVKGNRVSIRLGDKDFLGYDPSGSIDPDDTEPLHWLVFYIEGLLGDWAFVTPETYNRVTRGGTYETRWGRFAKGFMISRQNYEDNGWDRVVAFEEVRHPFSGFSPLDIFAEALREFKLRSFVQKALDAAVKGKKI